MKLGLHTTTTRLNVHGHRVLSRRFNQILHKYYQFSSLVDGVSYWLNAGFLCIELCVYLPYLYFAMVTK